jgi:hypothetical protein
MAGLKELLRDSVVQSELRTVVHPFPADCYPCLGPPSASVLLEASINEEKFAHVEAELHQQLQLSCIRPCPCTLDHRHLWAPGCGLFQPVISRVLGERQAESLC